MNGNAFSLLAVFVLALGVGCSSSGGGTSDASADSQADASSNEDIPIFVDTAGDKETWGPDTADVKPEDGVTKCKLGTSCDDEDPCTMNDACDEDGECVGESFECTEATECYSGTCRGDGTCTYVLKSGYCRIDEVCYEVDERQPDDQCVGCDPQLNKTGWSNFESRPCDDSDFCTKSDVCLEGECVGSAVVCDDSEPCNGLETCDSAVGCVDGTPLECDDGNACNGLETCLEEFGCVTGEALQCDDNDACNGVETCDSETGCVAGVDPGCDDNDVCNGVETCDPETGCVTGTPLSCGDGDFCNGQESCHPIFGCTEGEPPDCNDDNTCTSDSCDPELGCQWVNLTGFTCDDGNPCTNDDYCDTGTCVGVPQVCPAGGAFCAVGCIGNTQQWCSGGEPFDFDCATLGATCGMLGVGNFVCVCDETYEPVCVDDTKITRCGLDGTAKISNCAAAGATCSNEGGIAACLCDPESDTRTCLDDGTLAVCNVDGQLELTDCEGRGGACAYTGAIGATCECGENFASSCIDAHTWAWCDAGGSIQETDCSTWNTGCDLMAGVGGCLCGPGFIPKCIDGQHMAICGEGGVTQPLDCGEMDQVCGLNLEGLTACIGPGCPGIPETNLCAGDVLSSCVEGYLVETNCATEGKICAYDMEAGVGACVDPVQGCGEVTAEGECQGDTVVSCQGGQLTQFDCGYYGGTCAYSETDLRYRCACLDDFESYCTDNTHLMACDEGFLSPMDCGVSSGTCGIDGSGEFVCIGDACGDETWFGRCEGDTLTWCENNSVQTLDCAGQELVCGFDTVKQTNGCIDGTIGCGSITIAGQCSGDILSYCEEGTLIGLDCVQSDRECGFDPAGQWYECLGCVGITEAGVCDGDVVRWCDNDVVRTQDCGAFAATCGDTDEGYKWCVCDPNGFENLCLDTVVVFCDTNSGVVNSLDCAPLNGACSEDLYGVMNCIGSGCGSETYEGRCDGSSVIYCENDLIINYDCSANGKVCAWDPQSMYYNCMVPQGGCGDVTADGQCVGSVYSYCDSSAGFQEVKSVNCAATGKECGEISTGVFGCLDNTGCGDVTYEGECSGNLLSYCLNGQLVQVDCGVHQLTCGDAGTYMDCVTPTAGSCGAVTFFGSCADNVLTYCDSDQVATIDCAEFGLTCGDDGILGMNCLAEGSVGNCPVECPVGFFCLDGLCHSTGTAEREWVYLVYIAGDNNLTGAALGDIVEMESVGSSQDVAVLVQAEFSADPDYGAPAVLQNNTFRYEVQQDAQPDTVNMQPLLMGAMGNQNMGNSAVLSDFIGWGMANYPAKHYALVLWNHGSGWTGGFLDETSGDDLTLREIRTAIRDGGVFLDVVDFDACLMGMYEVVAELQDLAGYVVASEEVEPGCGNPYHLILGALAAEPTMTAAQLATEVVNDYVSFYETASGVCSHSGVTKSSLNMSRSLIFHERISTLANALRGDLHDHRPEILNLLTEAQHFEYPFYRDVADIAGLFVQSNLSQTTVTAAQALLDHILSGSGIVDANGVVPAVPGDLGLAGANGIAIFAPNDVEATTYSHLLQEYFSTLSYRQRQSAWSLFVQELVGFDANDTVGNPDGEVRLTWYSNEAMTIPGQSNLSLFIIEPDGTIYSPADTTATPNGTFSAESALAGTSIESYTYADGVALGSYYFFAVYEGNGGSQTAAFPRMSFELYGVAGYPFTAIRTDGYGNPLPMSLQTPLTNPIDVMVSGTLDAAAWDAIWGNEYSNIWMLPPVVVE